MTFISPLRNGILAVAVDTAFVMRESLQAKAAGIHIGSTQVFPNKIHAGAVYTLKI
jgi:hypothetical protein